MVDGLTGAVALLSINVAVVLVIVRFRTDDISNIGYRIIGLPIIAFVISTLTAAYSDSLRFGCYYAANQTTGKLAAVTAVVHAVCIIGVSSAAIVGIVDILRRLDGVDSLSPPSSSEPYSSTVFVYLLAPAIAAFLVDIFCMVLLRCSSTVPVDDDRLLSEPAVPLGLFAPPLLPSFDDDESVAVPPEDRLVNRTGVGLLILALQTFIAASRFDAGVDYSNVSWLLTFSTILAFVFLAAVAQLVVRICQVRTPVAYAYETGRSSSTGITAAGLRFVAGLSMLLFIVESALLLDGTISMPWSYPFLVPMASIQFSAAWLID